MAHIQRREGPRGVRYRVRYIDPNGDERSRTFDRKADAQDFVTSVRHQIRSNTYVDPKAGQQTLKAYLEQWRVEQAHHRPKTAAGTATRFRTMVYPYIGDMPIASIRPAHIRQWQARLLADGYAPRSVRGARGQVAGAFRAAIGDRLVTHSPFDGVKAPEVVRERVVPLTVEQLRAGVAATPPRYRAMLLLIAGTGMRISEAWGLTRDRLDLEAGRVRIDRQLAGRRGPEALFGPPKSRASNRIVPLARSTVEAMAKHLADYPAEPGELVFRTNRGTALTRTVWGKAWRPEAGGGPAEAMGLPPGAGLHQLRHFYASTLIAQGRSVKEVQERLGHASADETLTTYVHLFPDSDQGTRDAIDAVLEDLDDGAD